MQVLWSIPLKLAVAKSVLLFNLRHLQEGVRRLGLLPEPLDSMLHGDLPLSSELDDTAVNPAELLVCQELLILCSRRWERCQLVLQVSRMTLQKQSGYQRQLWQTRELRPVRPSAT